MSNVGVALTYGSPRRISRVGYNISSGLLTAVPHAGFDLAEHIMVGSAPTRTLTGGDVIDLGDRAFEVLHLPGHSPGSIGLWEEKSGTLFSGDAVDDRSPSHVDRNPPSSAGQRRPNR